MLPHEKFINLSDDYNYEKRLKEKMIEVYLIIENLKYPEE